MAALGGGGGDVVDGVGQGSVVVVVVGCFGGDEEGAELIELLANHLPLDGEDTDGLREVR